MIFNRFLFGQIKNSLFIFLGLLLPISIAASNTLLILLSFLVLMELIYDSKLHHKIFSSKWMISIICLVVLYYLSFAIFGFFSETGWTLRRVSLLLALPILYSINFNNKIINISTFGFLFSMFISSVIAILQPGVLVKKYGIVYLDDNWQYAAFLKYTDHNVFLSAALILSIYAISFLNLRTIYKMTILVFIPFYILSLFSEAGKAGQIVFLLLLLIFFIFKYKDRFIILTFSLIGIVLFTFLIYNNSPIVKNRFDNEIKNSIYNKDSDRNILLESTIKLIKDQPILGRGAGSFKEEFADINREKTNRMIDLRNESKDIVKKEKLNNQINRNNKILNKHKTPHNDYLYVCVELGLVGLIMFLLIFYFQIQEMYKRSFFWTSFPIMFLVLMLFDSYFFSPISSILYIFLSLIAINYQRISS